MGSVSVLTSTGDNDPEIYPTDYYRHYLYCDQCGSFDLKLWPITKNWHRLHRMTERLNLLNVLSLWAALAAVVIALVTVAVGFLLGGGFVFPEGSILFLLLSLMVYGGSWLPLRALESKTEFRGVRCDRCEKVYEDGSPLFTDHDNNPRNYTEKDVPPPAHNPYWVRGETIGPAEERSSNTLPP